MATPGETGLYDAMPMPRSLLLWFLSTLALAAGVLGPCARGAAAADAAVPSALFIIDGSGSMWGRFETSEERRAKIEVVRDLVRPIISGDTRARIGLQSFGHRRRSDCSDIEVIATPTTDRSGVLAALEKLSPRGKGPLADAVRQAAQAIGAQRPASIIVINDGADNCRQDPCAAAADAAKMAPGVPIHVIGIGIDTSEQSGVQCVAKATGGKFYDVRDPLALAAAIQDATSLSLGPAGTPAQTASEQKKAEPQTPEQAAAAAALPAAALRATLVLASGMKSLTTPSTWRLFKKGSETPLHTLSATGFAQDVEPGDYVLTAEHDGLSASTPVTIEAGTSATLALSLKAGHLAVKTKITQPSPLISVKETADGKTAGRTVALQRAASFDAVLPPATYIVSLIAGEMRQEKTVKIAEGTEASADFDLGTGSLAVTAKLQEAGPALSDVTFAVEEDDPDSPGGRREVRRSRAPDPRFTLPPGTYYVVVRSGFAETRQRIAVNSGDALDKTIVLPAAEVKLAASVGSAAVADDAGLVFRITALDGEKGEIVRVAGTSFSGLLNAGRYRATATLEKHGATATQEIVVEPGKPLSKILRIEAGEVTLKGAVQGALDTFWEVRDSSGKAVWHAAIPEPRVLLTPGHYSVRMGLRDKSLEAAFAVAAGETKTVELGAH